jgi:hypothetical protein
MGQSETSERRLQSSPGVASRPGESPGPSPRGVSESPLRGEADEGETAGDGLPARLLGQSACRHQWDLVAFDNRAIAVVGSIPWYGNWHKGEPRLRCRYCGRWQFELNDEDGCVGDLTSRGRSK